MPAPPARTPSTPSRRLRWLGVAFALAALSLGVHSALQAHHATQLREAYIDDLQTIVRHSPTDGPALALLGARLAETDRFSEAAEVLARAIQAGQRDELLWRTWAACLTASGQRPAARAVLEEAQKGGASDTATIRQALERTASLPTEASDLDIAKALCPAGPGELAERFSQGSYLNTLSDTLARRDRAHSGFSYRQRLARANPDDAPIQILWSEALRRNGRLRDAETAATKALRLAPQSREAQLAYAAVLLDGGAAVKAALQYRQLLARNPDWLPALVGLGRAATEKKLHRLALENLEKATQRDPNNVEAWIALGKTYFYQGLRYDLSLNAYQKAITLAPERTDFFTPMSDALRANYKFAEAEALLRRRLADTPRDAQAHYMLAYLLTTQQSTPARASEAEKHLRTSLNLEPNVPVVQQALAQALLEKNDAAQAADAGVLLTAVLEANPRNIGAMRLLAQAYRRIGKPEKAKEVQDDATKLSELDNQIRRLVEQELTHPADIAIHQQLAVLYQRTGENEKSLQEQGMIQMLKTHPEQAAKGLQALMDATMRETAAPNTPR